MTPLRQLRGRVAVTAQTRLLSRRLLGRVQAGPFAGMRLDGQSSWGTHAGFNYLLGSYERELHPAIESAITRGYDTVIDVGCAEGYYAIGMARRLPDARVIAYDVDPEARRICRAGAQVNGVSVDVRAECTPAELGAVIAGRTLIISDCEGYEVELLSLEAAPALAAADLIVELHDFIDPSIGPTIRGRFVDTHDIEVVRARPRDPADYPQLRGLRPRMRAQALDEGRPVVPHPMEWAILLSRSSRPSAIGSEDE